MKMKRKRRAAKLLNLCFSSVTKYVNAAANSHKTRQLSTSTKSTGKERTQKTKTKTSKATENKKAQKEVTKKRSRRAAKSKPYTLNLNHQPP